MFHSLSNDVKTKTNEECVQEFIEIIENVEQRFKDTKVIKSRLSWMFAANIDVPFNVKCTLSSELKNQLIGFPLYDKFELSHIVIFPEFFLNPDLKTAGMKMMRILMICLVMGIV
jgi:hypothetical protein